MNAAPPPAPSEAPVVTVSEFSKRLRDVFRRVRAFEYLGISGEISEWTPRPTGVFFTLKDAGAVLQCFAHHSRASTFPMVAPGAAIVAYGTVRVAEWRSRYELVVDVVALTGTGELYRQFEELKERFRRLGYFDAARKRPIPAFPLSVVLISARGKGAEDFITTMRDRARNVRVELLETRVQGIGADVEIAQSFDRAARSGADVIVLARGGGAYEDLFAFNREPVVRAIVRSPIPVITGIGHTGDHHLADDVADLTCETPSNAAQYIATLWLRGEERLARLVLRLDREILVVLAGAAERADEGDERLNLALERATHRWSDRLMKLERRLSAQNPALRVARRAERLSAARTALQTWPVRALPAWRNAVNERRERLATLRRHYFEQRGNTLELARSRLFSADPMKPLERGYAIVTLAGHALRDARDAAPGDAIAARLHHGSLHARVERVLPYDE